MHEQSTRKYFYLGLFVAGAVLTLLIFWPFVRVIVLSVALSAVFSPVYLFLKRHLHVPWVAALLTVAIFVLVLCVPLFAIGTIVFKQSQSLYAWVNAHGGFDNITTLFNQSISRLFPSGAINLQQSISALTEKFSIHVESAFTATLSTLFSFLLVVLSMFYFLRDGFDWKEMLIKFSPLSDESGRKIVERLYTAVNGIIKGYLLIAVIQGALLGFGLYIFGVPRAALWGVAAGIASLIPTFGTAFVSVPSVLFLLITGHTGAAIGLALWAALLVGTIDNMLNPVFVGRNIAIHPLLVLFAVLGGVAMMGPIGILIGPLVVSFMYALISVYKKETA
ncbi:MAG TPA: AI-2E family transporter [Candidatus Paceibacterota bacterium]|nr:AI-2E family transporter [Candidatus Paceibacterota bacterium]